MNTTHTLKNKLITSAVGAAMAAAVPALLFAGAGTAQASPNPPPNGSNDLFVKYFRDPSGVTAAIFDRTNPPGQTERCHYHADGIGTTASLPFDADVFPNGGNPADLFIPGIPGGGQWTVTVSCDHGGSVSFQETY